MRILVTGGSGSVGKAIIERLVRRGDRVRVIGRRSGLSFAGAEYRVCDVTDFPSLREAVRDCEVIVHLAALANPGDGTAEEVYRINTLGSFHVFQAAAEEGIRRVIQASSINAAGQFFGVKPAPLHYLPLDEDHPVFSTDAYSFSKNIVEATAQYFWRREGISSISLRYPWVVSEKIRREMFSEEHEFTRLCQELAALPFEERRAWFKRAWAEYNEFRLGKPYELPRVRETWSDEDNPFMRNQALMAMSQRVNFFTMIDERDSALAVEKCLTAQFEGALPLFINDHLNWTGIDSALLADLFFPDVQVFKKPLVGRESLVSIDKARSIIGFVPEHTFGE